MGADARTILAERCDLAVATDAAGRATPSEPTLKRVLRAINRFGLRAGLQVARFYLRPRSGLVRVRLPGIGRELWGRAGTSDVATFEEIFGEHHYWLPFADFEPRSILDLGANVGYASVYFAAHWLAAEILAVEPAPASAELLRKNIAAWPRIAHLRAAVWPHPTRVSIANPGDEPNAFRMSEAALAAADAIPAYTIAQLLERQGWRRVDLLKMDIEGAEREIFQNGSDWLDRVDVLIIELHDRIVPGCAQAFYRALHGRRFRQEIMGQNLAIDFR